MEEECCKLEKEDLLRLFACLQSELEAREIALEVLKNEKLQSINLRSKYGIINGENKTKGFEDPFVALQRDSLVIPSTANSEAALKPLYDTQLLQLETLIASQRYAQNKMREQLIVMEKRYLKACEELEEERRKHESDAAQGDDVLVMLEKERERLKSEVEYERQQNKKLVRELKRVLSAWKEQDALCRKQKLAGINIIKERRQLLNQLSSEQKKIAELECALNVAKNTPTSKNITTGGNHEKVGKEEELTSNSIPNQGTCQECDLLKKKLAQEVSSRKVLQANFERLKQDFQKLTTEGSKKESGPSCSVDQPTRSMSTSPTNSDLRVSTTVSSCGKELISSATSQRPKPHPPMRRSSEITSSSSPPTNLCQASVFGSETNSSSISDQQSPSSENYPAANCISIDVEPSTTKSNTNPERSTESSSRSSTPSPPPPPPLVQLYYPYPGMQNHLSHGTSRGPFISSNSTRSSIILNHGTQSNKSRVSVPSTTAHQSSPPYQPQYTTPVQSAMVSNRSPITPSQTSRPNLSRKPATVNIQHSHFHSPSNQSIFVQSQAKPQNVSQFSQRNGPAPVVHSHPIPVGGHHFPAFTPHRPHSVTSSGPRPHGSGQSNATSLATSSAVVGPGHVCVNGK